MKVDWSDTMKLMRKLHQVIKSKSKKRKEYILYILSINGEK